VRALQPCRPRGVRASFRRTEASTASWWTADRRGVSASPFPRAPRLGRGRTGLGPRASRRACRARWPCHVIRPGVPPLPRPRRFAGAVPKIAVHKLAVDPVYHRRSPWPLLPPSFAPLDSHSPTTSLPPLDTKQPSSSPCTPHRRQGRWHTGLQRAQRLRPAVGARQRRDRPRILPKSTRVNPQGTPGPSSGQVRPPPAVNSCRRRGQSA
jgi:hypothetical protein